MVGRYIVREGNNRRVICMLLKEVPFPQSVQIQFHVFSQPRNTYAVFGNVVLFFWGDPVANLSQNPLLVSYVANPNTHGTPFKTLSVKKELVFADSLQLPNVK